MESAPTELVWTDVYEGSGEAAAPRGFVDVHYLGVDYGSGEECDSSSSRGQSIEFPLATRRSSTSWACNCPEVSRARLYTGGIISQTL